MCNQSRTTGQAANPLLGDALCLGAATLYGISNVGQEASVKKFSSLEFLAMIGCFGSLIGGVQAYALTSTNAALALNQRETR